MKTLLEKAKNLHSITSNVIITIIIIILLLCLLLFCFCYYHYCYYYYNLFFSFFWYVGPIRPEGSPFGRFLTLGCCELKE